MGVEKQRLAAGGPKRDDDVADAGARHAALLVDGVAGELVAQDGVEPEAPDLADQPYAHRIVAEAVRRMRLLVAEDRREPRLCPSRFELAGCGMFANGGRLDQDRRRRQPSEKRREQRAKQNRRTQWLPPWPLYPP